MIEKHQVVQLLNPKCISLEQFHNELFIVDFAHVQKFIQIIEIFLIELKSMLRV